MREKGITQRLQSVEEVRASLAGHGSRISTRLDERLARPAEARPANTLPPESAEGDATFSYGLQFQQLDNELATIQSALIAAEDVHVRQQIRISQLTSRSDRLTEELRDRQVAVRRSLSGLFGSERCFELLAITGDTPRSRKALVEQVDLTIKLLREPEGELPPILVPGIQVDFEAVADGLAGLLAELDATRLELAKERKVADGTRLAKNAAIADFNGVFPWVAHTLESQFRLVGEQELADRIRTSARRVTRRQAAETPEEGSAQGSVAPAAGEASPTGPRTSSTASLGGARPRIAPGRATGSGADQRAGREWVAVGPLRGRPGSDGAASTRVRGSTSTARAAGVDVRAR